MKFNIGDKVAVLDDTIKGEIVRIHEKDITIKDIDGMQYVFFSSELVKIGGFQQELNEHRNIDFDLLKSKQEAPQKKKPAFKKSKNEVILEVDLHIQHLVKSARGMDNYDILNLQIDTAKRKIEYALGKRISKIIFIHGVGEGVLKSELQFLLKNYPVKFHDASYQKYGLGATEVYIFQNPI